MTQNNNAINRKFYFKTNHFNNVNPKATAVKQEQSSLCENCPNTEFFLVRIYPHSDWIRRDTSYLSVFGPNAGKYGPEKDPYLDTFHTVAMNKIVLHWKRKNNWKSKESIRKP